MGKSKKEFNNSFTLSCVTDRELTSIEKGIIGNYLFHHFVTGLTKVQGKPFKAHSVAVFNEPLTKKETQELFSKSRDFIWGS